MQAEIDRFSVVQTPDIAHSIRRLGRYAAIVDTMLDQYNERYHTSLRASRPAVTHTFLEWSRAFDEQRGAAHRDRRDFSHFAAGLMLRAMIHNAPVRALDGAFRDRARSRQALSDPSATDRLVAFWPEGFFYFEFCITVLDAVLHELDLGGVEVSPNALDLRTWWSFRENVAEDPDRAIPFLDLLLSGDPNWDFPLAAHLRMAMRRELMGEAPSGPGEGRGA